MLCLYSCGGVRFCTMLAAVSRGSLPDIQDVRKRVSNDGRHHAILQPYLRRALLPERSHQPHPLQCDVKEVQGCGMYSLRP